MSTRAGTSPVGVIGVGYVGLVTAACFADLGHEVVCRDIDAARVEALQSGDAPIYEPGIDRLLERNRGRMTFTLDMADVFARCRVVFVCVDTPQMQSGDADLSRVNRVLDELPALDERVVLVMKSTVPVGTAARLQPELEARGLGHVGYVSNPEFLREGRAIADFMEPDRIVIGSFEPADGDRVAALYADLDAPVVRTDPASSEMSKYASNAFLATKISFINEIANVCEQVDADVTVVAHAMGLDERIGTHFLRPGIGYGGSCLPGDETVQVVDADAIREVSLQHLYESHGGEGSVIEPIGLSVLSWSPGSDQPEFLPVSTLTRRPYTGEVVTITCAGGQRVTATADHPFLVLGDRDPEPVVEPAATVAVGDRLPMVVEGDLPSIDPVRQMTGALAQPVEPVVQRVVSTTVTSVERSSFDGDVYSMEVPDTETFVTSGGLIVHNCFPKDVQALKQLAGNSGYHFQLLTAVIEVNELQKRRVVGKLERHLGPLRGRRIALLGLAFKANTDDMREASSLVLSARLLAEGAHVVAYDPVAGPAARRVLDDRVELADSMLEAVRGADAAVVVTEWGEFRSLASAVVRDSMATAVIVDGRNLLDPAQARAAGFAYESVGRPGSDPA